jgi:GTP-binding protein
VTITAEFVTSAASAADFPRSGAPEIAFVGRSNVGKSSLINALVRRRVARISAAPGKTRLANIYRVVREPAGPLYLVDLPGYGYARGRTEGARAFEQVTRAYFGREGREGWDGPPARRTALLLVDARHPGLDVDATAWKWLTATVDSVGIVATKIDKLARVERIRAMRTFESVFDDAVLPVSAATGEGLDHLWKLIDKLAHPPNPNPPRRRSPGATARPHPTR